MIGLSRCSAVCGLLALLAFAGSASAHRTGESYVYIIATEDSLEGRVEARLTDLNEAVPIDDDGDGELTVDEFEAHQDEVRRYIFDRVAVGTEGRDFPLRFTGIRYIKLRWATFALFDFKAEGVDSPPETIEAEYRALYDVIPEHRAFLLIERNDRVGLKDNEASWSAVFSPSEPRHTLDLNEQVITNGFLSYLKHGVHHILIGTDHVLFVLALLMTSVLRREGSGWAPVGAFRPALINVVKVVTIFTVAHSVTLSAAALGWIDLSPRIVESIIALSV
ncbi:MAG: HupE/UreJ family protein, partial [Acidobacteriota bacterium]